MTRQGNKPRSTDRMADVLTSTPSLLNQALQNRNAHVSSEQEVRGR